MNQRQTKGDRPRSPYDVFPDDAFSRLDESDDAVFYARDRFVPHLDSVALGTVERIIGELVVEERPTILDLMASWDSHIPGNLHPEKVVGLGLNANELHENPILSERVIHDLNHNPLLPFPEETFDVVINTVSVDYLTKPFEVFQEVARVLKPGGLFLVIFSNRMFPEKATNLWQTSSENERAAMVEGFFRNTRGFEEPRAFVSRGRPRPQDDRYAHRGIPSDPIYAVYADKQGAQPKKRPRPDPGSANEPVTTLLEAKGKEPAHQRHAVLSPLRWRMRKWEPPNSPFSNWDTEYAYICFNDECPYLVRGWNVMDRQGNRGMSYRVMYDPKRDSCMPIPIISLHALKEGIVD